MNLGSLSLEILFIVIMLYCFNIAIFLVRVRLLVFRRGFILLLIGSFVLELKFYIY